MVTPETLLKQPESGRRENLLVSPPRRAQNFSTLVRHLWFKRGLFFASDVVAIVISHDLAGYFTRVWLGVPPANLDPPQYYAFYVPFFVAILHFFDGYKDAASRRPEKELELGFKAISFYFVALACANFILFKTQGFSRYLITSWYALAVPLVLAARFALRGVYSYLWRRGLARETTLLIGTPVRVTELQRQFSVQRHFRYDVVGALLESATSSPLDRNLAELPVLGTLEDWEPIVDQLSVGCLIFSFPATDLHRYSPVREIARRCKEKGIDVQVHSDFLDSWDFEYQRDEFSGCFRFSSPASWWRPVQMAAKSVMDRIVGMIGSIATLALTPIVALLLRLEDPGPVFYRREFVDQDGVVRYYLKFRTMVTNADDVLRTDRILKQQFEHKYKLEHDPRVLKVGRLLRKYSFDEFPQFFSLLTGRLSFIGPRVISSEETARYGSLLPKLLSVKPGLTGYWQVTGRQTTSYQERVDMDMFYIDHWSIWLDLVIAAKTFWMVLRADGAY